ARLGGTEAEVSAQDCHRRTATASLRRDRAGRGHRYDPDQDDGRAPWGPLRDQRAEGLYLAGAALRPDDPAGAHHAARSGEEAVGGAVRLPGRPAGGDRPWDGSPADRDDDEPRDERR